MELYITAFLTGLVGSFHCIGMCGPIALALPDAGKSLGQKLTGRILYNAGRIITYSILGMLLGWAGFGLKLAGMQQSVSIASGVIIIVMVVFASGVIEKRIGNPFRLIPQKGIHWLFHSGNNFALLLIGLLNGLLPCGFVYVGLMGSVATQSVTGGALFMTFFGLGTFPMMYGVSIAGQFINLAIRQRIQKIVPVFAVAIGLLFILRGLNLGIPYISPELSAGNGVVEECCEGE